MSVSHTTAVRAVLGDAVVGTSGALGANGKLVIYSGAAPANAQASLSGNVAIATITALVFGVNAAGVSTITGSTQDSNAVGGTASFFRLTTSAGVPVLQGSCGLSSADCVLNSLTIVAGAAVRLTSGSYTAPA